ncbi:MAG: tetratricopeptide repeat protein [Treponema sp.]|uniref:tetratricopeptide repeat protein n=1 Tax=Treponema sp. TaxID=166 RepID=UPI001B6D2753|nr:tetratricopeptide repeat protein [Treponema sp.]MBP3772981.1 tetratricopeptide repeat protein [Treponema sp.]MBQ9282394.1 tetratricopeptide repeat protein [Treponema sp.]
MDVAAGEELSKGYAFLEEGSLAQAREVLEQAMAFNFENSEIRFAYWCCSYWVDFIQGLPKLEAYEQGDGLVARWKSFKPDYESHKDFQQKAVYALQRGVFKHALKAYSLVKDEGPTAQRADLLRKKGLCYKKLGEYESALNMLSEAYRLSPQSAAILAEMADCLALCGEEKNAKVLFREAFFVDAQRVELEFLDSELICCLIRQVKEKGYTGAVLQEWIPVYGVLYGVFNVKRELRTQEAGRLRQEIFAKENEIKDPSNDSKILVPKLINMYFWLIDHYARSNEGRAKINECLLQIRVHNEDIYRMYTK